MDICSYAVVVSLPDSRVVRSLVTNDPAVYQEWTNSNHIVRNRATEKVFFLDDKFTIHHGMNYVVNSMGSDTKCQIDLVKRLSSDEAVPFASVLRDKAICEYDFSVAEKKLIPFL